MATKYVTLKDSNGDTLYPQAVATNLAPGSIGTSLLADGAVTSAKIADGTIASGDIADGAITSAKLGASALALFPKKTLLASGGTRTTTTTHLSQAPSNFDFLLVDITSNDNARQCIIVPATAGLFDAFDSFYYSGVIYFKTTQWVINGSTITRNASHGYASTWGGISSGDNHGIVNVYGIKY